jgi:hypothetical protein
MRPDAERNPVPTRIPFDILHHHARVTQRAAASRVGAGIFLVGTYWRIQVFSSRSRSVRSFQDRCARAVHLD